MNIKSFFKKKFKSLNNKKLFVPMLIALLTVGYATVATIMTMNGTVALGEKGFIVKINRSVLNGTNRPTFINKSGDVLLFETTDIIEIGESILDYEIVNMSSNYDAKAQITCTTDASNVTIHTSSEQKFVEAGKSYTGQVTMESTKRDETGEVPADAKKLYDLVKSQSSGIDTVVGINYDMINQEHGVFETIDTDTGTPVYFYRGEVDNNIIYANKCWNIVRTTETGGTKLIYAGIPMNGSCDQSKLLSGGTMGIVANWVDSKTSKADDNAYVGYMYGELNGSSYEATHANINSSYVKNIVDDWFEKNIKDTKYEEMLEDTVFCNDRSLVTDFSNVEEKDAAYYTDNFGYGKKMAYYAGAARVGLNVLHTLPTLKCIQPNDRFTTKTENGNGALTYPVALITADEVVYAGASGGGKKVTNSYLFKKEVYSDSAHSMWTMTPAKYYNGLSLFHIHWNSSLGNHFGNESLNSIFLQPMLSLSNDNYVVSGDGSLNNPYVLFTKGEATDKITCKLHVTAVEREKMADEYDGIRSLYDSVAISSLGTVEENNIDYDLISSDTNGKGVYVTDDTDSGKPVYFYRGNVEDNNVIFADHCWQIVRTTSSSGTKLVYNGEVGADGTCNSVGDARAIGTSVWNSKVGDNAYIGYMYGDLKATTYEDTHKPVNDSDVKKMVDAWYEENLLGTKYEDMLEDVVFCNDRQVESDYSNYKYPGWLKTANYNTKGYGTEKTIYQGTGRVGIVVGKTTPTLKCGNLNDRFTVSDKIGNGALKYPIGLMTADETVLAGSTGGFQGKNTAANNFDYYLFTGGSHSWTMTPHRSDTTGIMLVAGAEGNIGNEVLNTTANEDKNVKAVLVRPVVSIKNDVMIVDGNGTKLSPYVLKEKRELDANKIPNDWKDNGIFKDYYVDAYNLLKKLTIEEKVGQLIVAHHNQSTAIEGVIKYNISGYTYFEADFLGKTEAQVKKMIADEQAASKIPLITAVDEEGGRVVRISSTPGLVANELSKYPDLFYTNVNNKNAWKLSRDLYAEGGLSLIETETKVKSEVLNRLGLNVNFAPVVDMAIEGAYISDRVIGLDATGTAEYAKTVINASKGTNVSYTLKHFPGYGNNADTHSSSSVDNKTLEELMNNDIVPFKTGIDNGAEAVMISHNIVAAVDSENPASLSKNINTLLTKDLGFTGIVITDALDMGATKDIEKKFLKAIKAGNHQILVQKYADAYEELLTSVKNGELSEEEVDRLVFKVLAWKYYKGLI